jgi:hypothetical protein
MRQHHNTEAGSKQLGFGFVYEPEKSVKVRCDLGTFDSQNFRQNIRQVLTNIVGGDGESIPVRVLVPSKCTAINDALGSYGLAVGFTDDEIVIKPNIVGREGAHDGGGFRRD